MNANKRASAQNWTDPDDAPELTEEFFERADEFVGEKLVRRGRPALAVKKEAKTIRYDEEVLSAFQATGKGWQTRMNAALRDWLRTHDPKDLSV
jgi:uncharacterized protein (DUF4415 family)